MNGTTILSTETATAERVALVPCDSCGATLAPSGACLEIGACASADDSAARRSAVGATLKFTPAPSAWNVRGGVD